MKGCTDPLHLFPRKGQNPYRNHVHNSANISKTHIGSAAEIKKAHIPHHETGDYINHKPCAGINTGKRTARRPCCP